MKTVVRVNPISEFRAMDEMFERLFGRTPMASPTATNLPLDIFERDSKFFVRASVPGISPESLDVQVEDSVLTIRGEIRHDYEGEDVKVYRREVSYGSFARSIRLPENLNLDKIDAEFSNGFVTISIPKLEEVKPKALKVTVRSANETTSEPKIIEAQAKTKSQS